jgi:ribosomal protein S18 acetylase RimI-like enzyme/L-amino acid N-acyltransferase YncA
MAERCGKLLLMLTNSKVQETLRRMSIRRLRKRDLSHLFELNAKAFKEDAVTTGLSVDRLSRAVKLYGLLEKLLPLFDVFHKDFETILVAVSDNKLIGEIHLSPHGNKIWNLYSSAVDTMFRGHGVFRKLMKEALEYISKRHGERVFGSVRTDKIPVMKTFRKLEFEVFETQVLLRLVRSEIPLVKFGAGELIREFKPTDIAQIYQICRALSPRKMQLYKMAPADFLDSLVSRIMNRVAWSYSKKWVMAIEGKIVGYTHCIYTPPQEAGKIESFYVLRSNKSSELKGVLLSEVLRFLAARNIRKVTTSLNEEWRETIEIFERFGFRPFASVNEMVKELV